MKCCRLSELMQFSLNSSESQEGYAAWKEMKYSVAISKWNPLSQQKNSEAQNNLGVLYAGGFGVRQDYKAAVDYFKSASKTGLPSAQINLAVMYCNGFGVEQSNELALAWYSAAAANGIAVAGHRRDIVTNYMKSAEICAAQHLATQIMACNDAGHECECALRYG